MSPPQTSLEEQPLDSESPINTEPLPIMPLPVLPAPEPEPEPEEPEPVVPSPTMPQPITPLPSRIPPEMKPLPVIPVPIVLSRTRTIPLSLQTINTQPLDVVPSRDPSRSTPTNTAVPNPALGNGQDAQATLPLIFLPVEFEEAPTPIDNPAPIPNERADPTDVVSPPLAQPPSPPSLPLQQPPPSLPPPQRPPSQSPPPPNSLPGEGQTCVNACRNGLICSVGICVRVAPPPRTITPPSPPLLRPTPFFPRENENCSTLCSPGLICSSGKCVRTSPVVSPPLPLPMPLNHNSCTTYCPLGQVCIFGRCIPKSPYKPLFNNNNNHYYMPNYPSINADSSPETILPELMEDSLSDDGGSNFGTSRYLNGDNNDGYLWENELPDANDFSASLMSSSAGLLDSASLDSDDDSDDEDDVDKRKKAKKKVEHFLVSSM
ncbi:hypothetical protein BDF19DRAFT_499192 [Syncephalis fuscata]|nr:hypothetical protein BDF19DRAFT_499192 [Syncephalis fuscata]